MPRQVDLLRLLVTAVSKVVVVVRSSQCYVEHVGSLALLNEFARSCPSAIIVAL